MPHLLCTFNANNLFVRYKFGKKYPGDLTQDPPVLSSQFGFLPPNDKQSFQIFKPEQRTMTARALTNDGATLPDIVCLQEIESLIALRLFNEEFFTSNPYPHALLIDSRDFRQIDVGILSRLEILGVRSHIDDPDTAPGSEFVFSRDCLEVELALSANRTLTLFINHLKSKFATGNTAAERAADRERGDKLRKRQAKRIAQIVHNRFPGPAFNQEFFVVLGDLNDEPASATLKPLVVDAGLEDAIARIPTESDRWTHWFKSDNVVSQLDYLLLSPALATATAGQLPTIERRGVGFKGNSTVDGKSLPKLTHFVAVENGPQTDLDFRFPRFSGVSTTVAASDHCPVFFQIP